MEYQEGMNKIFTVINEMTNFYEEKLLGQFIVFRSLDRKYSKNSTRDNPDDWFEIYGKITQCNVILETNMLSASISLKLLCKYIEPETLELSPDLQFERTLKINLANLERYYLWAPDLETLKLLLEVED